jgi:hypothetical protein
MDEEYRGRNHEDDAVDCYGRLAERSEPDDNTGSGATRLGATRDESRTQLAKYEPRFSVFWPNALEGLADGTSLVVEHVLERVCALARFNLGLAVDGDELIWSARVVAAWARARTRARD